MLDPIHFHFLHTQNSKFDAVGVWKNEKFLDIGSVDGALVFAAPSCYGSDIHISRGVEIVPELMDQSNRHSKVMTKISEMSDDQIQLYCGDIYQCDEDNTLINYLRDTTLADITE